jgi:hypothetical protein
MPTFGLRAMSRKDTVGERSFQWRVDGTNASGLGQRRMLISRRRGFDETNRALKGRAEAS